MNKLFYPAIFHKEDDGFWVSFPDLPECLTEGDDMTKAYEMSVDALGLAITSRKEDNQSIPTPSPIDQIAVEDGFLVIVEFDMIAYLKKHSGKSVKKTLSIPEWMNEAAMTLGLNFSQILQEALLQKIQNI